MRHCVVVEVVKVDVVHALGDIRYPGELLLFSGGSQVDHASLPRLSVLCGNFEIKSKEKNLFVLKAFKRSRCLTFDRNPPVIILFCLVTAGVAQVTEAAVAEVAGVKAAILVAGHAVLAWLLGEADLGQRDLADVVHEVESPCSCPGGDYQVIGKEEALAHNLLLLAHDCQPAPAVTPGFIGQNLRRTF